MRNNLKSILIDEIDSEKEKRIVHRRTFQYKPDNIFWLT
jgi:hypothetical protein